MGKFLGHLNDELITFIGTQKMFFIATAASQGRINMSPKGLDTLRIVTPNQVAYLDLTGSGNETAAHLHHDGRLTIMFCSFDEKPLILRLYGQGRVIAKSAHDWLEWRARFPALPGDRQVIALDIDSIQTSCGFAVPHYEFNADRSMLSDWANKKGAAGLREYRRSRNTRSIDGLPTQLVDDDDERTL